MVIKLKESDLIDMIRATIDETETKYKKTSGMNLN